MALPPAVGNLYTATIDGTAVTSDWVALMTRTDLPGGDFEPLAFDAEVRRLGMDYAGLPPAMLGRMTRLYGTKARVLLGAAKTTADLGLHFGADLHAQEVDYLVANEWARTAQDVLWRRTKLGLRFNGDEVAALEAYLAR